MNLFSKIFIPLALGVCLLGFTGLGFSCKELNSSDAGTAVGEPRENSLVNPTPTAAVVSEETDSDFDGLSDQEEKSLGTNPFLADTDQDGYSDKQEIDSGHNPRGK